MEKKEGIRGQRKRQGGGTERGGQERAYCVQGMANEADECQEALAVTPQPCSQILRLLDEFLFVSEL